MRETKISSVLLGRHASNSSRFIAGFARSTLILCIAASVLSSAASAQSDITQTINATYSNLTSGYAIPNDFAGLSFETNSLGSGNYNVSGYLFSSSNSQLVTLFQQMGIRNLRIGGGTLSSLIYRPSDSDVASLFGFAQAAGIRVIYSVPVTDATTGNLSTDTEVYDASIVSYIWSNSSYVPLVHSFAIGNEEDAATTLPTYIGTYWSTIQSHIASNGGSGAPFSGPDSGSYNGVRSYSGTLCGGSPGTVFWAYGFAYCAKNTPWSFLTAATQHYYPGSGACNGGSTCTTQAQATSEML
jgi:hypothetical protein